jgi:hypothetical protein
VEQVHIQEQVRGLVQVVRQAVIQLLELLLVQHALQVHILVLALVLVPYVRQEVILGLVQHHARYVPQGHFVRPWDAHLVHLVLLVVMQVQPVL